jgi:MFS family permease
MINSTTDLPVSPAEKATLREISPQQWKSGLAACLGWLFDGLDMHLYTLVAGPFVASLLAVSDPSDPRVRTYSGWILAAFLLGWALGGGFFGYDPDLCPLHRPLSARTNVVALAHISVPGRARHRR